jgi:Family of unknown function (DUF6155)
MAKPKLNDFKKYLADLDEAALRAELLKLFGKLTQVQEFYAQELMSGEDRKGMLDGYKKKVLGHFYTRGGNPRNNVSNAEIRKLMTEFGKVSVFPHEQIDLLLYRVEVATGFASEFGGMPDADYKAAANAFEHAVKLMVEHKLGEHFEARCEELFKARNLDYWYIEWLEQVYESYFDPKPKVRGR